MRSADSLTCIVKFDGLQIIIHLKGEPTTKKPNNNNNMGFAICPVSSNILAHHEKETRRDKTTALCRLPAPDQTEHTNKRNKQRVMEETTTRDGEEIKWRKQPL
jgi:hypothetical protein